MNQDSGYWKEVEIWLLYRIPPCEKTWTVISAKLMASARVTADHLGVVKGKCWQDAVQETLGDLVEPGRAKWDPLKGSVQCFVFSILHKKISSHLFRPYVLTNKRIVPLDEELTVAALPAMDTGQFAKSDHNRNEWLPAIKDDPDAEKIIDEAQTVDSRPADVQISIATGLSKWRVRKTLKRLASSGAANDPHAMAVVEARKKVDSRRVHIQLSEKTGLTISEVKNGVRRIRRNREREFRRTGKLRRRGSGS